MWLGVTAALGIVPAVALACVGLIVYGPSVLQYARSAPRLPVAGTPAPARTPIAAGAASPTVEAAAFTPTPAVKAATPTPAPAADDLDTTDLSSAVAWLIDLVEQRQAGRVAALIGPDGAQVAPYGVGADYLGVDNGDEVARQLDLALAHSDPILEGCDLCMGCMPDKVTVWYTGMASLEASTGDCLGTGFNLWKREGKWQLVFITCLQWENGDLSTLDACAALP